MLSRILSGGIETVAFDNIPNCPVYLQPVASDCKPDANDLDDI
jgi:hypothetical protein